MVNIADKVYGSCHRQKSTSYDEREFIDDVLVSIEFCLTQTY